MTSRAKASQTSPPGVVSSPAPGGELHPTDTPIWDQYMAARWDAMIAGWAADVEDQAEPAEGATL